MDIQAYVFLSSVIIMIWHLAFNIKPVNFELFQMIGVFVICGIVGWYLGSLTFAIIAAIGVSWIFIG